ncbi:hypothetical protein FHS68_001813 [Dyadobacter arcticus]|uniref:Uncharacterized protein n=1 Tax=Dyadobacter arcticus TaxID=1078754 RepID=A0ABX0UHY9_9BACT|nr:hypothetical protein [Dyadobacter arcticus]
MREVEQFDPQQRSTQEKDDPEVTYDKLKGR